MVSLMVDQKYCNVLYVFTVMVGCIQSKTLNMQPQDGKASFALSPVPSCSVPSCFDRGLEAWK